MTENSSINMTATTGNPAVWPCLAYRDAPAAIKFLVEAFGLVERARYEQDGLVQHAELGWPGGAGGIMLGSVRDGDDYSRAPGVGSTYVVTDKPDALLARAVAAGAKVTQDIRDEDYGNRGFTVLDPEGNQWSFGTYRGA